LAVLASGQLVSGGGSLDETVRVWNSELRAEARRAPGERWLGALVVLPGERTLAAGGSDGVIRLFDLQTAEEVGELRGHTESVDALAILHDGKVASGGAVSAIRLWDADGRVEVKRLICDPPPGASSLAVLSRTLLASAEFYRGVRVWDVETGEVVASLMSKFVHAIARLKDGRLAFGGGNGDWRIGVCDAELRREAVYLEGTRTWCSPWPACPTAGSRPEEPIV
jgi:WD40 repeat protein